jgi:hypothetical protein
MSAGETPEILDGSVTAVMFASSRLGLAFPDFHSYTGNQVTLLFEQTRGD